MCSPLWAYFELVEMLEGVLQRPVKLQLAFQLQERLFILFCSGDGTFQHLGGGNAEFPDECRNPRRCSVVLRFV